MTAPYAWTEKDGVWRRSLGATESFYLTLATPEGQPVHLMIGCCLSIAYRGNDDVNVEEALRRGWKDIHHEFPNITAVVDPSTRELTVRSYDASTVDQWLQKSFQVHDGITADELFSGFRSQYCITLHFLRDRNELVIQVPHILLDGRGILYLFHALFTTVSRQAESQVNGDLTKEPLNLSKPYDEWLGISQTPSEKNLKDAESIFHRVLLQEKPIRLPGVDLTSQPRKPVHRDLSLGVETTRAVIEACKRKGVTVTSAWHAAIAMATQGIQSSAGEEGTSYAQFTTIDLRRWFPSSFIPQRHSVASLQTALAFRVDLDQDNSFEKLSQSLHKQYKAPFAFAEDDLSFLNPYMAMAQQIIASGAAPPSSTPYMSSMGVVNDFLAPRYGDWELGNFWISSTILTSDFQIYLWTWKDEMVFSACYNEGYYETNDVDAILTKSRDEMVQGLGIHSLVGGQ